MSARNVAIAEGVRDGMLCARGRELPLRVVTAGEWIRLRRGVDARRVADDPAPFAWIHDIFVTPEQRRGVASMLMAEAERFARSQGARLLRLDIF